MHTKVEIQRLDDTEWLVLVAFFRKKKLLKIAVEDQKEAENLKNLFLGKIS